VSDERLRLFVALALPSEVTEALVRWREGAVAGVPGLRLLDEGHLHVTLCFLGWQAAEAADGVGAACRGVALSVSAPELVLGEAVWLPPRRPRVLAVALDDPGGGLGRLQSLLSASLQEGGWYAPERRPYMGHVTVARVRGGAKLGSAELAPPPTLSFAASEVILFRSFLSPAGARYEALAQMGLRVS
jgi:RNA 2',3'-cyclic 3'-phosphodiesterase